MDIIGNVVPFIGGEEEKMQQETQKILGRLRGRSHRAAGREGERALQPRAGGRWPYGYGLGGVFAQAIAGRHAATRSRPSAVCRRSAICRARRRSPVQYMAEDDRPQPRKDAERERGMAAFVGRLRAVPGVRLEVCGAGPQHHSRRGGRGGAECGTDAFGRAARLMIVMKFGGTSVESAEAIERVAGIVQGSASDRQPVVVVSAMGKTTNKLLAIAQLRQRRDERDEYIRADCTICATSHSREARQLVVALARSRRTRPLARRPLSGTDGTGEGIGGAGRTDAALHRRHFQLRRAAVELHRGAGVRALRPAGGACGFAQGDRHRPPAHAGRAAVRGNVHGARSDCAAAGARTRWS